MSVSAVCSSTNLKFGKAPSCGEKRAECFMCFCVCVSKHEDIFAHALARVHGDVMEKGRNVTDRVRQEEEESSISSASLCFTLLLYLFVRGKKEEPLNKDTKRSCAGESRNLRGRIRVFPKVHLNHKHKKQAGKQQQSPAVSEPSISLGVLVK